MKIILSRKGFDSGYGGIPSPILPDKTLLSLPIPYRKGIQYSEPIYDGKSYLDIIHQLHKKTKIHKEDTCHLDPDIRQECIPRYRGWKGLYGQSDKQQQHLVNQGVGKNDIFLFFGWFKEAEEVNGNIQYKAKAQDLHVIFGYLQIGEMFTKKEQLKPEMCYHPHGQFDEKNDCIYEATDYLTLDESKPGFGTFKLRDELVLTKGENTRSRWDLPDNFKELSISCHTKNSFKQDYFQSVRKGQEFVFEYNEITESWLKRILNLK